LSVQPAVLEISKLGKTGSFPCLVSHGRLEEHQATYFSGEVSSDLRPSGAKMHHRLYKNNQASVRILRGLKMAGPLFRQLFA
jgi:hypothetical protein